MITAIADGIVMIVVCYYSFKSRQRYVNPKADYNVKLKQQQVKRKLKLKVPCVKFQGDTFTLNGIKKQQHVHVLV